MVLHVSDLGSPKAARDVVMKELYCCFSLLGSSSGWCPGKAVGSRADDGKKSYECFCVV